MKLSEQCKATVYVRVRDTYLAGGYGKQCGRLAKENGYCWQHQYEVGTQ